MADLTAASAALACATSSRSIHARSVSSFTVLRCQNRPCGRQHRFEFLGPQATSLPPSTFGSDSQCCPATFHRLLARTPHLAR